ncbi:LOW QUALITY PROTEIN: hypothetical protein V2J09_000451 [Rumex salicifolius]
MCNKNLISILAVHVGSVEPRSFDALVSKACNVERKLARPKACTSRLQVNETRKDDNKRLQKRGESMATFIRPTNRALVETNPKSQGKGAREPYKKLTLQERKEKKYPFDDDDVQGIFKELISSKLLVLPKPNWPNEVEKTNDAKFYPYHHIVSHLIKDFYVLTDINERDENLYKSKDISTTLGFRMIEEQKEGEQGQEEKWSIIDSDAEYVQPNRIPITLKEFIPKGILKDDSLKDDEFWSDEIAQCCMTTWANMCEEEKLEVDEVTLHFVHQRASQKVKGKKKKKESTPCDDVRETNLDEEVKKEVPNPSSKENEKPETSHQEKTSRVPLILHNAPFKEKIKYDVIGHLKRIPARLSVYDALKMSNDLR